MSFTAEKKVANAPGVLWLLLRTTTLRHWRKSWKETFALLLLLAAGVAAFLSIRMANRAAVFSFEQFTRTLTGQTDGILRSASGNLSLDDLTLLRDKLARYPVRLLPVLEQFGALPEDTKMQPAGASQAWVQLIGLDLLAVQNLPRIQQRANRLIFSDEGPSEDTTLFEILQRRGQVYVNPGWAADRGLQLQEPFQILLDDRTHTLQVAGFIPDDPELPKVSDSILIMDIAALQDLSGRPGSFTRIEWVVVPGARSEEFRSKIQTALASDPPSHWAVDDNRGNRNTGAVMTRAFRLNLTVLSLIALLVGLYLVVQALEAAVVRRRPEIATLRSLGVTPATIQRAWLAEAFVLGLAGSVPGILLGWAGAQLSVQAVAETVNALYQASSAQAAMLGPGDVAFGLLLGCGASLLAGWIPAREAARTPPAQLLVRGYTDPGLPMLNKPGIGLILLVAGVVLALLPALPVGDGVLFPLAGYLAALCWLVGGTLLLGPLIRVVAGIAQRLVGERPTAFLATARLRKPSGRHKLAAAGLLVALAMAHAMTILISSFEYTMRDWIGHTLQADVYMTSAANQTSSARSRISLETVEQVAAHPGVDHVEALRSHSVTLEGKITRLSGVDLERAVGMQRFRFLDVQSAGAKQPAFWFGSPAAALVSESFSRRFGKKTGDLLSLPMPNAGPRVVKIAGIFADYGNEQGAILVPELLIVEGFGDPGVTSLAITLKQGLDTEQMRLLWSTAFPALQVRSNTALRAEVMRIFRQTFSITYALKAIALAVAATGLGLGLFSLILEYRSDLQTLRSLGMRHHQLAMVTGWEGILLTLAATVAGLAISLLLGLDLIYVINRQSFGWTLAFSLPWGELLAVSALVIAAGGLVSWFAGFRGRSLSVDREE